MTTYHARVVVDQGVAPPVTPQIIPDPGSGCVILEIFGSGEITYTVGTRSRSDSCDVTIRLSGYRKNDTTLHNASVVVMRRPGSYANPTVSIATLEAPEEARKAYEKGVAQMVSKKWEAAGSQFHRAVTVYPNYAPAWNALGEVLIEQSKPEEARQAFERAIKSDPKFAPAWAHLAHLAASEGRAQDALDAAARALDLDSTGFPQVYVSQAQADLALKRLDAAEKSARRAVELDTFHEIPEAESVLGSVLAEKGDTKGAIEHWKKYLEMSPKAADAPAIRNRITALDGGL